MEGQCTATLFLVGAQTCRVLDAYVWILTEGAPVFKLFRDETSPPCYLKGCATLPKTSIDSKELVKCPSTSDLVTNQVPCNFVLVKKVIAIMTNVRFVTFEIDILQVRL